MQETILQSVGKTPLVKLRRVTEGLAPAVYAKVGILVLVIFFLQLKPTGLFPAKERTATGVVR